jgi:inhibitor of cysteine peptidase
MAAFAYWLKGLPVNRRSACSFFLQLTVAVCLITLMATGKTMLLDENDNNTRVVLYVGDIVSLKLKSNMTTGYGWNTKDLPSSLLQIDSKAEPGKEGRAGAAGLQTFAFKAVAPGECTLQLNYFRRFEKDTPPAKTFHLLLSIEARPGSTSAQQ